MNTPRSRQQGLALPVMLIMLVFMLISSVYLFKSSNSTALTASNLAYEDAMTRSADLGIVQGSAWLRVTAATTAAVLNSDSSINGYKATFDTTRSVNSPEFWDGSVTVTDAANNRIEYIMHRLCSMPLPYHNTLNRCVHTAGSTVSKPGAQRAGDSTAIDTPDYMGPPQVHYIITSRIFGKRGGNVINQAVLVSGA